MDTRTERYTTVAIVLHWAIAVCILFNLGLGFFMEGFPKPLKGVIIPLHFSAGITVLALTALRVLWRLTHRPPPLDAHMPGYERAAAHAVHAALYVAMVAMPLVGWAIISAHPPKPVATMVWSVLPLPPLGFVSTIQPAALQKHWHDVFVNWHLVGGWIMVALLVLHVAGALKHQMIDRTAELQRMGLGRRRIARRRIA